MAKFIKIFIILILGGWLIYRYFFYIDVFNGCFIKIKPSITELSSVNIKKAIKVLKKAEPSEYKKLCRYVNVINPNFSCGGFQGGCFYSSNPNPKEIDISTSRQEFLGWTAAIIVHETCHAIQFREKGQTGLNEEECYLTHDNLLQKIVVY